MESELAACPVCGEEVIVDDGGFAMEAKGVFCEHCGYNILRDPGEVPDEWTEHGCREWLAHDHNTLARRAEIGALVERLVDGLGYLQMECEADANGEVGMYDVRSHDASAYTDTLLDALRALAKEVSGDD